MAGKEFLQLFISVFAGLIKDKPVVYKNKKPSVSGGFFVRNNN
jgi:hypothetical protein